MKSEAHGVSACHSVLWVGTGCRSAAELGDITMKRSFLFGLGWMLIVTAVMGALASMAPGNKIGTVWLVAASGLRVLTALVAFYFASNALPARRWPAIGMWFLGFVLGYPLGNGVINGALFAVSAALR